ncbi:MAG: hypothetical protein ACYS3N_02215 [Planctomycetota bacterium]
MKKYKEGIPTKPFGGASLYSITTTALTEASSNPTKQPKLPLFSCGGIRD